MELDLEALLRELFEDRIPADRTCYALNVALGFKPWVKPCVELWAWHTKGLDSHNRQDFDDAALEILKDLYADYLTSKGEK